MDTTPAISRFDEFYRTTTPPWVIGEPQPAIVELETGRADPRKGARRRLRNGRTHDPAHQARLRRARHRLRARGGRAGPPQCRGQGRGGAVRGRRRDEPARPSRATTRSSTARCSTSSTTPTGRNTSPACTMRAGRAASCTCWRSPTQGRGFGPRGQRRDHPGGLRRRMGAGGAGADDLPRCRHRGARRRASGCRSAPASMSPRGWPGSFFSSYPGWAIAKPMTHQGA